MGMFMAAMEVTIVSTAMPSVVADLGGFRLYSWVFTAYLLASTVTVPLYGKLADLYGRKPIMFVGIAFFMTGSTACGFAHTMTWLILFRAVQGLGAGAMQPVSLTIVGDLFSLKERAKMQGVFGAVWGLAGLVGPLLGGFIVKTLTWHWVFFLNIPFGLAAAAVLAVAFHEEVAHREHGLDLTGAGLLAGGVLAVLLGAHAHQPLWPVAGGFLLLGLFVWAERRAREPVLPLDLLRNRVMAVSSLAGVLVGGAMLSTITYIPLLVQGVLRGSPTDAGSAITPMVIGWPIASALGGRLLPVVGFRPLIWFGLSLSAAASIALVLVGGMDAGLGQIRAISMAFGAGLGFANTSLLIAVQTTVSWKQRGVATASTLFFRTIGGALAIGATGGILSRVLASNPAVPEDAVNQLLGPDHGASLGPSLLATLGGLLETGLGHVFLIIAGLALTALAVTLFFPRLSTRDREAA
jgi:EmrB/QacA subfamily drug resistance transporter